MTDLQAIAACIDAAERGVMLDRETVRRAREAYAGVNRMRSALLEIEELATDTPTVSDMEGALNFIKSVCENTLESAP